MVSLYKRATLTASFLACLPVFSLLAQPSHADTTSIRELAKNNWQLYFIESGPNAIAVARVIQGQILRHPDNKHSLGDFHDLTITDADTMAKSGQTLFKTPTVVLLDREEMTTPLPASLQLLIADPSTQVPTDSIVTQTSLGDSKSQVPSVELLAPDKDRLSKLAQTFIVHGAPTFRDLTYTATYHSNYVAAFADAQTKDALTGWGNIDDTDVWNDIAWHDLGEIGSIPAADLAGRTPIYFIDSSNDSIPSVATDLLPSGVTAKASIVVARGAANATDPNVYKSAIFLAPSRNIVVHKAMRYSSVQAIPADGFTGNAIDLSAMKTSVLIADTGSIDNSTSSRILAYLSRNLETALGVNVDNRTVEFTDAQDDVSLGALELDSPMLESLRKTSGLRYAWHFTLSTYSGRTHYTVNQKQITPAPAQFRDPPTEPSKHRLFQSDMSDDDFKKAMDQYHGDYRKWQDDHDDYIYKVKHSDFQWDQEIDATSHSRVVCILRLVDLRQPGSSAKVLWETESSGNEDSNFVYQSNKVTVRGPETVPDQLPNPDDSETCSAELMQGALEKAVSHGLNTLQEVMILPPTTVSTP